MRKPARSLLDEPTDGQRVAISLTTFMAGAIGAYYMHFYWDMPHDLTIPLHMDPKVSRTLPWAPWWIPVSIMAVITMAFWRAFVARARGISTKSAVTTLFIVFALHHGVKFICLDYGVALQYVPPPPLWHMLAMFPFQLLGGLFTTGVKLLLGGPGEWIATLVLASAAGIPTAGLGKLIWRLAS